MLDQPATCIVIKWDWNTAVPVGLQIVYVYLHVSVEELSCYGGHMACKASSIYSLALSRSLLTSTLENREMNMRGVIHSLCHSLLHGMSMSHCLGDAELGLCT